MDKTYTILTGFSDYHLGFEIQLPQKEFFSWDTPYGQLIANGHIMEEIEGEDIFTRFKHPVRLGNLLIEKFYLRETSERGGMPVLGFRANCDDNAQSDTSFWSLKELLIRDLGDGSYGGYEQSDQNYCGLEIDDIQIEISYDYPSCSAANYTYFSVTNHREYLELLENKDYENNVSVDSILLFDKDLSLTIDYKKNALVQQIPQQIRAQSNNKPIIWSDSKNQKFGFADSKTAFVIDEAELDHITVWNTLPAKGAGRATLYVYLKNGKVYCIFQGDCHAFTEYQKAITNLFSQKVEFQEDFDC